MLGGSDGFGPCVFRVSSLGIVERRTRHACEAFAKKTVDPYNTLPLL